MISIFTTAVSNTLREITEIEKGAWVHLCDPTKEEIKRVVSELEIEEDFIRAALDEEETPRIDYEDNATLIIVDIPVVRPEGISFLYSTMPLGIIIAEDNIVTVCLDETTIIEDFLNKRVKGFDTCKRTRFLLQILYKNASKYLQFLRQIDKQTTQVENALHRSMKNRDLIQMLKIEKSLVFFSTSLKSNEVVLEKLLKANMLSRYPDDTELLEDVITENKQAMEMCSIYKDVLAGTMDAFASIISNNLNIVMKLLASVTILMAIPTMFASFWGMNFADVPLSGVTGGFWIIVGVSATVTAIVGIILWRKKMF